MQPFDYVKPRDYAEASALLAGGDGAAQPLMGGTDLIVRIRSGALRPRRVVDLKGLPGMCEISGTREGGLRIGAGCTMNQVARHPAIRKEYELLALACDSVASYQIRNRATVGGNCCNASPAADSAPALYCLAAQAEIYTPAGPRILPIEAFFVGPGHTALEPGELLIGLLLPPAPPLSAAAFNKLGRTRAGDIATASVAVYAFHRQPESTGHHVPLVWRIALGAVGPVPIRATEAEAALAADASAEGIRRASGLASQAASPIDDVRASAAYRRAMVRVLARRGVEAVIAGLGGVA